MARFPPTNCPFSAFIGVDKKPLAKKIREFQPEYMPMGTAGMADMGVMEMPLPDNTIPMMTGWGPHGPIEMGGMFSVVKVRDGIDADDYSDPGWYANPLGGSLQQQLLQPVQQLLLQQPV